MVTKKEIRTAMLKKRASYPQEELQKQSSEIAENLFARMEYQACKTLFCYVSFRKEADTHRIIEKALSDGKKVAVPKVEGKEMHFYRIESLQELSISSCGILEPDRVCEPVLPKDGDLMAVPGAAFDRKGFRIGYGGGYYDRYLKDFPNVYTIGLAYDFQMMEELPTDTYDLAVKDVIYPVDRKQI